MLKRLITRKCITSILIATKIVTITTISCHSVFKGMLTRNSLQYSIHILSIEAKLYRQHELRFFLRVSIHSLFYQQSSRQFLGSNDDGYNSSTNFQILAVLAQHLEITLFLIVCKILSR